MQFSKNWLYEWVKLKFSPFELSQKLTMAGLEVDGVSNLTQFNGVLVAQVQSIEPHPKSDNLKVCQLQTGEALVQVVTAATNVAQGDKLVFAPVDTHLPAIHKPNEKLAIADFKGVESHGMLLSAQEMGIAENAQELFVLSQQAPVGDEVWSYLHLDDVIFDLDITPNRGDCLSIQGVAREIHALTKAEYSPVKIEAISPLNDDELKIDLNAAKACSRYCGRVIRNVDCKRSSPDWVKEKLRRSNIRSINPVVDIMSLIMIELGQPMHAFDLNHIKGNVQVRMSKVGESLALLDGQEVKLENETTLMIADEAKALAIAGVMGGLESAVTDITQDIFLESAFFAPESIAGVGRQIGVHTDSSFRFERGVDPALQAIAIERATQWILDICGGEPGPITDVSNEHLPAKQPMALSIEYAQRLLGYDLVVDEVIADLKRLGCEVTVQAQSLTVLPPSFRFDLNIQEDLIEEIARVKGYENIKPILPSGICKPKATKTIDEPRVKRAMVDMGYHEVITYSFVDEILQRHFHDAEQVRLVNPITNDMSVMRNSLWPGLVKAAAFNMHRQHSDLSLFETGLVFNQGDSLEQKKVLGGLCSGHSSNQHWRSKAQAVTFFDVKAHIEQLWQTTGKAIDKLSWKPCSEKALHPGQAAQILFEGKQIGRLGALHPKLEKQLDLHGPVFVFELDFAAIQSQTKVQFAKPSLYPAMRRDLSFVVAEKTTSAQITDWLKEEGGHMLKDIQIFDLYQGKGVPDGHKSMALGLVWQDARRTLIDSDVDEVVNHLVQGLKKTFDAQLRD